MSCTLARSKIISYFIKLEKPLCFHKDQYIHVLIIFQLSFIAFETLSVARRIFPRFTNLRDSIATVEALTINPATYWLSQLKD